MSKVFIQERPEVIIVMSIPEAKQFFRFVRDCDHKCEFDWLYNSVFKEIWNYECSQQEVEKDQGEEDENDPIDCFENGSKLMDTFKAKAVYAGKLKAKTLNEMMKEEEVE